MIFPRCPEMMPIYLWNTMKVLIWRTRLIMGLRKRCSLGLGCWWNQQISESSPSSENSDVIHVCCPACSLMTLEVEEEKERNERHNSTGPVGSGSGVNWDSACHFSAMAKVSCDAHRGRLTGLLCARGSQETKLPCGRGSTLQAGTSDRFHHFLKKLI